MVCIAALVVIVVIGVYRIHATHQEGSREDEDEVKDPEVNWDKSALNITVNPMEVTQDLFSFIVFTMHNVTKSDISDTVSLRFVLTLWNLFEVVITRFRIFN